MRIMENGNYYIRGLLVISGYIGVCRGVTESRMRVDFKYIWEYVEIPLFLLLEAARHVAEARS